MLGTNTKFLLNNMNATAGAVQMGTEIHKLKNVVRATYDFAVSGGAIGDIVLLDDNGQPIVLPPKTIITDVKIDVLTVPTSLGSATVALKAENAGDMLAATAIASVTGIMQGLPSAGNTTHAIKTTLSDTLKATIATAALTAGKFNVFVTYVFSAS